MLAKPAPGDDLLNMSDVFASSDTIKISSKLPSGAFTTNKPSQPTVSGSRSLTTLIRDLHAEFADLTQIMSEESFGPAMESDEEDVGPDSESSGALSDTSDDSITSLLDDLEQLAGTVRTLPIPRPPSLTKDEWQTALDSPDPRFSGHFEDNIVMPTGTMQTITQQVYPGGTEPTIVQDEKDVDLVDSPARPRLLRRSATVGASLPMSFTVTYPIHELAEDIVHVSSPSKLPAPKDITSIKRPSPQRVNDLVHPSDSPELPNSKQRFRGLSLSGLNTRRKAAPNADPPRSRQMREPLSFLAF